MSGSNNLPIGVKLEGIDQVTRQIRDLAEEFKRPVAAAEQLPAAVNRTSDAFNALERRTQSAVGSMRDLRGAMELIGATGAAGGLGQAAGVIGNFADAFGTAGLAAGRFTGLLSGLSTVAVPLGATLAVVGAAAGTLGIAYQAVAKANEEARAAQELYSVALRTSNDLLGRYVQTAEDAFNAKRQETEQSLRNAMALEREALARSAETASRAAGVRARLEEAVAQGRASPAQVAGGLARLAPLEGGVLAIQEGITIRMGGLQRNLDDLGNLRFIPPNSGRGGGGNAGGGARDQSLTVSLSEDIRRQDDAAARAEEQARERREREEEQHLRRIEQANERTTDNIVKYGADAFADMAQNMGGSFDQVFARVLQTGRQTFLRLAADAVIRPGVSSAVSGAGLGEGGFAPSMFGLSGLGSQLSGALGLGGGSFGLGGSISNLINTPLWGGDVAGPAFNGVAASGAPTIGGILGGAGLGFGAGMLTNTLLGGRSTGGMIGSGGGALAGAVIGSIIPGIGTALGGLIGGAGGGALGGLFGPDPNRPPFWGVNLVGEDGALSVQNTGGKRDNGQAAALLAQAQQQAAQVNAVLRAGGLSISGQTMIGSDPNDPTRPGDVGAAFNRFRFTAANANVNTAVAGREFGSLDELTGAASWVTGVYNALTAATEPADAFAEQMKALNAQFDAAATRARELGLSETGLEAARIRAINAADAARESAAAGQVVGQVTGLADFVRGLRVAPDNPLSPMGRLAAARGDFQRQADLAAGGDLSAYARVAGSAQSYLAVSRDINGSGTGYAADFAATLGRLETLGGLSEDRLTASVYVAEQRSMVDVLRDEIGRLRAEVTGLRADVAQGNRMPARLAA